MKKIFLPIAVLLTLALITQSSFVKKTYPITKKFCGPTFKFKNETIQTTSLNYVEVSGGNFFDSQTNISAGNEYTTSQASSTGYYTILVTVGVPRTNGRIRVLDPSNNLIACQTILGPRGVDLPIQWEYYLDASVCGTYTIVYDNGSCP